MFVTIFGIVLTFVLLLVPGYVLAKKGFIERRATLSFGNILMYVAMPCLVFSKLLELDFSRVGGTEVIISAVMPVFVELALLLICRFTFAENGKKRVATICSLFSNCGFLGIPLAAAIWQDTPETVLYISIFNVVSTFLLLTLGVRLLTGDTKEMNFRKGLFSPITFAIILGAVCSVTGVAERFSLIATFSETLAQLTTPLSMIALGVELSALNVVTMWRSLLVFHVSFMKLCVAPLLAVAVLFALKTVGVQFGDALVNAMLISCGVSAAASIPSMARKYGADAELAAILTLTGTVLCVITLPLLFEVAQYCGR